MAGLLCRRQRREVSSWQQLSRCCTLSIPHLGALGTQVSDVSFRPVGLFASTQHLELYSWEHFNLRLPAGPRNRL